MLVTPVVVAGTLVVVAPDVGVVVVVVAVAGMVGDAAPVFGVAVMTASVVLTVGLFSYFICFAVLEIILDKSLF